MTHREMLTKLGRKLGMPEGAITGARLDTALLLPGFLEETVKWRNDLGDEANINELAESLRKVMGDPKKVSALFSFLAQA